MGLDLAIFVILELSFRSPNNNLYELPLSPCFLRHLSSFFGLNHTQFNTLHPNPITAAKTTQAAAITSLCNSIEVRRERERLLSSLREAGEYINIYSNKLREVAKWSYLGTQGFLPFKEVSGSIFLAGKLLKLLVVMPGRYLQGLEIN